MRIRICWLIFALLNCVPGLAWAVKLGEPAPELAVKDRSGAEVTLSAYRQKNVVVLLALGPDNLLTAEIRHDFCRRAEALNAVVLFLPGDSDTGRTLLNDTQAATILIDPGGVVRRVLAGRALTGSDLAEFIKVWQYGKLVFETSCARCHGEDGARTSVKT